MSSTVTFKCPNCGVHLEFDPSEQQFKCFYCGTTLTEDELKAHSAQREAEAQQSAEEAECEQTQQEDMLRGYRCQMCGAEIVTDATTAATRCYYCHSPIVLTDRLQAEFRPDGVIPFTLDKASAEKKFSDFVKKKKFIDRKFFDSAQLEMFSGVYYPYWYVDVEGQGRFSGQGTRTSVSTTPSHIIRTTNHYQVEREGRLSFRGMIRKALNKVDGKLSDGIHPFDFGGIEPYASGYLSGFLAEKRDIELDAVRGDILREADGYADRLMKKSAGFDTLMGDAQFKCDAVRSRYVLLPAWVLTYKGGKDGVPYYYLMNGQTGRICGKLPLDKGKLALWALGVGAAVFLALCAGGRFIW